MKFNFKKMFYMKTLLYLASREVYYQYYKITERFIHISKDVKKSSLIFLIVLTGTVCATDIKAVGEDLTYCRE